MIGALASWRSGRGLPVPWRLASHPYPDGVRSTGPWHVRVLGLSALQARTGSGFPWVEGRLCGYIARPEKDWTHGTPVVRCRSAMPEWFPWARKSEDGDEFRSESPRRHQSRRVLSFRRLAKTFGRYSGLGLGAQFRGIVRFAHL